MLRKTAFGIRLSVLLLLLLCPLVSSAETITLYATDRGWYNDAGEYSLQNGNYVAGYDDNHEHRNFFVFDISNVTGSVVSATLTLPPGRFYSDDPTENYELHDVVVPISNLTAAIDGVGTFNDLGSGVVYADRTVSASDFADLVFPLNSSAVDALNNTSGSFAIGGSITTLSYTGRSEVEFGFTGFPTAIPRFPFPEIITLQLTLVPEPTSAALIAFAAMIIGTQRSRKRAI